LHELEREEELLRGPLLRTLIINPQYNSKVSATPEETSYVPQELLENQTISEFGRITSILKNVIIIQSLTTKRIPTNDELSRAKELSLSTVKHEKKKQPFAVTEDDAVTIGEGTTVFLSNRKPLGVVCEVFGPIYKPFYKVILPNENDILQMLEVSDLERVQQMVTSQNKPLLAYSADQFTSKIDLSKVQMFTATDASWKEDEEVPIYAMDFSDDEEERRAKKAYKLQHNNDYHDDYVDNNTVMNNNNNNNNNTSPFSINNNDNSITPSFDAIPPQQHNKRGKARVMDNGKKVPFAANTASTKQQPNNKRKFNNNNNSNTKQQQTIPEAAAMTLATAIQPEQPSEQGTSIGNNNSIDLNSGEAASNDDNATSVQQTTIAAEDFLQDDKVHRALTPPRRLSQAMMIVEKEVDLNGDDDAPAKSIMDY